MINRFALLTLNAPWTVTYVDDNYEEPWSKVFLTEEAALLFLLNAGWSRAEQTTSPLTVVEIDIDDKYSVWTPNKPERSYDIWEPIGNDNVTIRRAAVYVLERLQAPDDVHLTVCLIVLQLNYRFHGFGYEVAANISEATEHDWNERRDPILSLLMPEPLIVRGIGFWPEAQMARDCGAQYYHSLKQQYGDFLHGAICANVLRDLSRDPIADYGRVGSGRPKNEQH